MPDGDHEVRVAEDMQLSEFDLPVDVLGGAEDREEHIVVALQFRSLVGGDRILDRQRMQAELLPDRGQLALGRPLEPDPGHAPLLSQESS